MASHYGALEMAKQRDKSNEKDARQARLSDALRANLQRRKTQARQRREDAAGAAGPNVAKKPADKSG